MTYRLGTRSKENLEGVHFDLVKVVRRAIELTEQDFTVIDGLRTEREQRKLVARGVSKTMNSRHLTGHAVDIVPYPIPRDWNEYQAVQWRMIEDAMKQAAKELKVSIEWGGDWKNGWDKPHYQLPRGEYK